MANQGLESLNTSIIVNSLMKDVGEEVYLPFLPSINTITANTSNDGNIVSINAGNLTSTSAQSRDIPKYGKFSCAAIEYTMATANVLSPAVSNNADNLQAHPAYANLEYVEVRSQGKKLLSYTGIGIHHMLSNYLTKSQFDAVMHLAGNSASLKSILILPLFGAMFDKKLCPDTVLLDRMEIVYKFRAFGGVTLPTTNDATLHLFYHQVGPEVDAKLREAMYSAGTRNILCYDVQSYAVSTTSRVDLTSQKLVRCHYVDEYKDSDGTAINYAVASTQAISDAARTDKVNVSAAGRVIYEGSKALTATLGAVLYGKEVNNTRCLCVDYRNGVLKGSSSDYSSGLALRHLPQPTLSLSAFASGRDRLLVNEEAYVMLALEPNTGRISVVAEN